MLNTKIGKLLLLSSLFVFFVLPFSTLAHQPRVIFLQTGDIKISNPEISQAFYDDLKGNPRDYFIDSSKDFELYINLMVPETSDKIISLYSARIFSAADTNPESYQEKQIAELDGGSVTWQEFYEPFGRDYYLKGPEFSERIAGGKYKIEVYSKGNQGKYVLVVGKIESLDVKSFLNIYWQLPFLKLTFFKTSVWQFFLTPFGIAGVGIVGAILALIATIYYLIGLIKTIVKHHRAKTLLLTSGGMTFMNDEVLKLLQKPAYDITVAFITTAHKPKLEENPNYLSRSLSIMKDMGFNTEEIDIEGKKEHEVMRLLELKDIIYVAGGNTFYLMKAMRECHFKKVIRKLLKHGIVYIGSSAGSIVAGRTIKTGLWKDPAKNMVGLKNLKGLNLVPFDIFVHYQPEHAELIRQKMPNPKKRLKRLKILTDEQAILVQGREADLIGEGGAVVI